MPSVVTENRSELRQTALPESLACLNPVIMDDLKRYGRKGDGGYLLPASAVEKIDGVISLGVSDDWSFEEVISRIRPGIPIHAYDHTISETFFRQQVRASIADIVSELVNISLLRPTASTSSSWLSRLIKKYQARRGVYRSYKSFFSQKAVHYQQRVFSRHEADSDATIDDIFGRLKGSSHLLLKMDIEGGEYRVIPQILERSEQIDVMVIEFHDTEPFRELFLRHVHEIVDHFYIIHCHGNNWLGAAPDGLPDVMEISFLNRRFALDSRRRRNRLPIAGLDTPNDPRKADFALSWRGDFSPSK